jgi:3-hydroxyacyl-CoA dehydrogenase
MTTEINSIAVLGGGTMGLGIAGLCAQNDKKVLILDISMEAAEKSLDRITNGRPPAVDDPEKSSNITLGTFADDLEKITDYDWICEAVIEDLETKRDLFLRVEEVRKEGSVISTNTSGIPLKDITQGMPDRLRRDIAVTHFFNPVKIMRLMELVPGEDTDPAVIEKLAAFCGGVLGKGVVYAKDTVNFIGNRIGCFWMLMGLHQATQSLDDGLSMETIDALMSKPVGLPPTGLYGLIDLIGLDVMDLVGKNLAINLPAGDMGVDFTSFPSAVRALLERGQIGRKAGGGFYRMIKHDDGSKTVEVFDLKAGDWRVSEKAVLDDAHATLDGLFIDDVEGKFSWEMMSGVLSYAADLVPEIADDVVNIDRAMRWGFAWARGPFELIDALGPNRMLERLKAEGRHVPRMLQVLADAGADGFYRNDGAEYLGLDGAYHPTPAE